MPTPVVTGDLIAAADWNAIGAWTLGEEVVASSTSANLSFDANKYRSILFYAVGIPSANGTTRLRIGSGSQFSGSNYRSAMWARNADDTGGAVAGGEGSSWSCARALTSSTVISGVVNLGAGGASSFTATGFASTGGGAASNSQSTAGGYLTTTVSSIDLIAVLAPVGQTWTSMTLRAWGLI